MTTAADRADETAFEAVLAGRPAPAGAAGFTAFTQAVRATATQPGRPSPALAELLATGLIVDQPSPSPRTANRRRRRMWFFTAIIAKIASAGAVAQAATGAGIVLVGFTTAGAAGVLPGPVQQSFTSVVSHVTDDQQATATPAITSPATTSTTDVSATSKATATATRSEENASGTHGPDWKPAKDATPSGENYGRSVSDAAHEKNGKGDDDESTATATATPRGAVSPQTRTSGDESGSRRGGGQGDR